ncbi:uncharacterized protein Bfra_008430 [Botrytis fragariae]|uniref:Uncharacterized protein n=1 Tax=Botrytis fragariae TaxID=1964551 RepID=A0A8H6EI62_9HELO|nr:uncharacterized protein Bfra_008430 [Botrytis fragariae]KAF5873152.1 hypothetical protein Bfra_008430 [Botrytis fragariae]
MYHQSPSYSLRCGSAPALMLKWQRRGGYWALNNTEQHIQETRLGTSDNIGMNGKKNLVLDTTIEKGDEEARSPTLAYRENEKMGGRGGCSGAMKQSWWKTVVTAAADIPLRRASSYVLSDIYGVEKLKWLSFAIERPHILALSGQLSIKSGEHFSTEVVATGSSGTENNTAILIFGRNVSKNSLLALILSSLLRCITKHYPTIMMWLLISIESFSKSSHLLASPGNSRQLASHCPEGTFESIQILGVNSHHHATSLVPWRDSP